MGDVASGSVPAGFTVAHSSPCRHFRIGELASFVGKPRGKGFLNGVLRKVASLLTVDFTEAPGVDALPLSSLPPLYRRLSQPILPDPATHPAEYLATGFSWPVWLAKRWLTRYGWEECVRLGFWFSGPAPLYLRCNPLQIDRTMVLQSLTEAQVQTEAGQHEQSLKLIENVAIPTLPGFSRGWFTVQDESAMWVGSTLAPQPGMRVLDLCAAPGGKTTHLAELMQNQGQIIACDMDATRLQTVSDLCERLGITIVEPCLLNPSTHEEPPPGPFDAILVDVPCSNTGVLGRRPEVRWRLKPGEFQHLVRLQTKLLLQAGERIRSGGHIVYSTCSIEPEENQQVFQVVLRGMSDLVLEQEKIQIPGQPADGGYWACYRRK